MKLFPDWLLVRADGSVAGRARILAELGDVVEATAAAFPRSDIAQQYRQAVRRARGPS